MDKSSIRTAFLNKTGLWNGYARVSAKYILGPDINSITKLLGFNLTHSSVQTVRNLFKSSYENINSCTLFEIPKAVTEIIITDKKLESSYGFIGRNALKRITQCDIEISNEPSGKFSVLRLWLLFRVKPQKKIGEKVFHYVSVWLKYNHNHSEENNPAFEFQLSLPECFLEESRHNPEFIDEVVNSLGF